MQIDELRSELAALAHEMDPFEGDVGALHRRERRRRVVAASVAAMLVVAVAVSTVAITRRDPGGRVQVNAPVSKLVAADRVTRVDAVVVPDTPAVEALLDGSPLVAGYTRVPQTLPTGGPTNGFARATGDARAAVCALTRGNGLAVTATAPGDAFGAAVTHALAGHAEVHPVAPDADFEIFFKVGASQKEIEADRGVVTSDGDVASARLVTQHEAYEIFKHDFADQPALIASTKPSSLPESLRIVVRPGRDIPSVQRRYQPGGIIDTVIANSSTRLLDPSDRQRVIDAADCPTH